MKKFFLVLVLVLFTQPLYAATIYLGIGVNAKVKTNDDYAPEIIALHNIIKPGLSRHILGSDVTTNNVTKGLEWLNKTATETDISIVYISAHGHYDKNYRFSGYNWEKIYGSLIAQYINITKGKIILIVDTCHSGGILKENWTNTKIAIFTACREDESSWGRYFCEKLSKHSVKPNLFAPLTLRDT